MSFFHPFRDRKKEKKRQRDPVGKTKRDKKRGATDDERRASVTDSAKQTTISTDIDYDFSRPSGSRNAKPLAQDADTNASLALTNLETVTSKRKSIEDDIKAIYAHLNEVQNNLKDNLNRESSLIQDQMAYSDSQRRMVERKANQIRDTIDDTKSKLTELNLKKLDAQVAQLQERKRVAEDDQHNNEVRITSIQQQLAESKKQRGSLQRDISDLDTDKNNLFLQLKSEDKIEAFLEKAEPVRNKISALSSQQDQKSKDIEKLLDHEARLKDTAQKVAEQNKALQAHLDDIEVTIKQIGQQRSKWETEIGEYQDSIKDLTMQLQGTADKLRSLKQRHEKWAKRLSTVQQKMLQFTNANVSTSNIDIDHGNYYLYSPDVPQLTKENRDAIRGYDHFFRQRSITPILLTTTYNEDGQHQLSELKRKANLDNGIKLINMYDDLQGRKTTRVPKKVAFTPDPSWRKAEAQDANQVQYFDTDDKIIRVIVFREDGQLIWMINYFEAGQLMKRDVFDRDGYLSVTQTFDILDHNQIKEERFYKDDGSVRLVKHYDTFAGGLIDIQLMDDQELLFNVFHSEADFQASWIRKKISEQDQSHLMLRISYSGFTKLAGSGSANYSLIPILDSMDQTKLKDALNRANLVQTVITDDPQKAGQFQEWFGQRYSVWMITKPDYDPSDFHIVLPSATK